MRAIIVAAGMGRRLAPYTDDRPKCLVEVNGRSILERQLDAYRAAGVDDVVIVRGYMKEKIAIEGARYFDNDQFRENNILVSMFYAEPAMDDGFLFSYSDIVFRPEVVRTVIDTEGDYALVIDRRWHEAYVGRMNHPVEEGEVARVDDDRVTLVGQEDDAAGGGDWRVHRPGALLARGGEQMRERFHERQSRAGGQALRTRAEVRGRLPDRPIERPHRRAARSCGRRSSTAAGARSTRWKIWSAPSPS